MKKMTWTEEEYTRSKSCSERFPNLFYIFHLLLSKVEPSHPIKKKKMKEKEMKDSREEKKEKSQLFFTVLIIVSIVFGIWTEERYKFLVQGGYMLILTTVISGLGLT